jgi:hypothetical protein
LKKLALAGGVLALGLGGLLVASTSHAADHGDSPNLLTNPMADIADLYAWMTPDVTKVNLVMTVSPFDDGRGPPANPTTPSTRHFGPSILYVFHVSSVTGLGMPGTETQVICRFNSDSDGECWVGDKAYVHGDPSNPAGAANADGSIRVFAGLRSDPFFFNLQGFHDAVAAVQATTGLTFDTAGCPQLNDTQGAALRALLQEPAQASAMAPCPTNNADCFVDKNVKAIVVQVDKSLFNTGSHTLLSVWASTNMVGQ